MVESRTKEIDGRSYTVTQMPAMKALRMSHRLGKAIGPAIGHLSGTEGTIDAGALGRAFEALFASMSEDDLEAITRELLNTATASVDGKVAPVIKEFDLLMAGQVDTIFKLLLFALEVNYGNFIDAAKNLAPESMAAVTALKSQG